MRFEINSVRLPAPTKRGRPTVYPFATMKVGDSFDAPRDQGIRISGKSQRDVRCAQVTSAAAAYSRRYGGKFATRIIDLHTVRCWRIA